MTIRDIQFPKDYFIKVWSGFKNRSKSTGNISLLLITVFLVLALILFFRIAYKNDSNRNIYVGDFRFDINKLTMAAETIESLRVDNNIPGAQTFGTEGGNLTADEINSGLKEALVKIADIDSDGSISDEEVSELAIKRIKPDIYREKLREFQLDFLSDDKNLKNYIVITHGKHAGTILYNGFMKFIDDENKRYFGIELWVYVV